MRYTGNHFPRQIVAEIIEGGVTGFIVESIEEAVEAVERIPSIDRRNAAPRREAPHRQPRLTAWVRARDRGTEEASGPELGEAVIA